MRSIQKFLIFGLLFSILLFFPALANRPSTGFNPENTPKSNLIAKPSLGDRLVNNDNDRTRQFAPASPGSDPGIPDTVKVGRIANAPPNTHLPPVDVFLVNDEPVGSFTVPLAFPDSVSDYDIICDSVSFAGTRCPFIIIDPPLPIDNVKNRLLIYYIFFAGQLDPGNGPVVKIYFSTGSNWRTDFSVPINTIVWPGGYGLQVTDSSGHASWVPIFNTGALEIKEGEIAEVPSKFELSQNYPNPFNPFTTIPFQVGDSRFVVHSPLRTTLKIYNILGQLVRTLVDKEKAPGNYNVVWDGKDDSGKEVSSGIYFYQLKTPD